MMNSLKLDPTLEAKLKPFYDAHGQNLREALYNKNNTLESIWNVYLHYALSQYHFDKVLSNTRTSTPWLQNRT